MTEIFIFLLLTIGFPLGLLLMMLISDDSPLIIWLKKIVTKKQVK